MTPQYLPYNYQMDQHRFIDTEMYELNGKYFAAFKVGQTLQTIDYEGENSGRNLAKLQYKCEVRNLKVLLEGLSQTASKENLTGADMFKAPLILGFIDGDKQDLPAKLFKDYNAYLIRFIACQNEKIYEYGRRTVLGKLLTFLKNNREAISQIPTGIEVLCLVPVNPEQAYPKGAAELEPWHPSDQTKTRTV